MDKHEQETEAAVWFDVVAGPEPELGVELEVLVGDEAGES